MSCREIEQDLNLKIQKVGPKAKRPKKNKKTPTHPMTMPQAAGKKGGLWWVITYTINKLIIVLEQCEIGNE